MSLALNMSSFEKCLFKSFAHFVIGLLNFLEWSPVNSLYVLEIKPLTEVSLANMFSHTVGSLYFNTVSFSHAETFYFDDIPLVYSFLYVPCCVLPWVQIFWDPLSFLFWKSISFVRLGKFSFIMFSNKF